VKHYAFREILFSIFVDAIFTTFIARLFTKVFDAQTAKPQRFLACIPRATPINPPAT
jgi:hypothetical protein